MSDEQLDRFNRAIEPFWVLLHRGHIVRRAILIVAVWMTLDSYEWAKRYAMTEDPNEIIYASVLAISSGLLAAAIKFYNTGRAAEPLKGE